MGIILKEAQAGTPEKNADCVVSIYPASENTIEIESIVKAQYGDAIRTSVEDELNKYEVKGARVVIVDRGAIDCVLRARVETAIKRGMEK